LGKLEIRAKQHEHHTRSLALCRRADGDSFFTSGNDRSLLRRSALLDVVGATGTRLLQQGTWYRFRHTREHRAFWRERVWCSLLQSCARAATSLLLFYFARRLFGATAGLWTVIGLNATPIFNIGSIVMTIDALSIFFLDGGDV
jgi:4-amino-4-deoxy-L-arabinose transferase and related glycosyltransferases of PMT family